MRDLLAVSKRACSAALVMSLLFSLIAKVNAQTIEQQKVILQMRIQEKEREITRTEEDLKQAKSPSYVAGCLWIGCLLGPIGALVWYFTDIKPKSDHKSDIKDKIKRLSQEKEQLQSQLNELLLKETGK